MLPTFTSLNADNPLSDTVTGNPLKPLSAGTSEPTAAFAGELARSALQLKPGETTEGGALPANGKLLPPGLSSGEIPPEIAELPAEDLETIFADLEDLARLSGRELDLAPIRAELQGTADGESPAQPDVIDLREGWKDAGTPVAPVLVDYSKDFDFLIPGAENADIELKDISLRPDGSLPPDALDPRVKLPPGLNVQPAVEATSAVNMQATVQATAPPSDGKAAALAATVASVQSSAAGSARRSIDDGKAAAVRPMAVQVEEKLLHARDLKARESVLPTGPSTADGDSVEQVRAPLLTTGSVSRFDVLGNLSEGLRQDAASLTRPAAAPAQVAATAAPTTSFQPLSSDSGLLQSSSTLTDTLSTSVRDPNWGERVSERVVMMANNRLQNAELRLTPAELGPLRVKVSMEDGLANVSFVATHSVTRDALEQAMPRLRSMLEEQGINLGQSSVDEQPAGGAFANEGDGDGDARAESSARGTDGASDAFSDSDEPETVTRKPTGLLDTFA